MGPAGISGHMVLEVNGVPYAAVMERWMGRTALVVGDVMLDRWCYGQAERVCREAAAPVFEVRRLSDAPGGAGNTAANVAALGARAVLVAPLGEDLPAGLLRTCLRDAQVEDRTVPVVGRTTAVKRRLLAGDRIVLREDDGAAPAEAPASAARRMIEQIEAVIEAVPDPILLVSDYGLGGVPEPVRRWLMVHRHRLATVGLDARDLRAWPGLAPTVVTPSLPEVAQAVAGSRRAGHDGDTGIALAHGRSLLDSLAATAVAVTLGREGAVLVTRDGGEYRTRAEAVPASYSVGAGDVYLAASTLAWAAGATPPEAAALAQGASQAGVSQPGTCRCDQAALRGSSNRPGRQDGRPKLVDRTGLVDQVRRCRRDGGQVVFTNGCFDLFHAGHVRHLQQARQLGDLLVVAINSDESVRRLKGHGRPVNQIADRVALVAALAWVDLVVVNEEDTAAELIEAVRPDVYVKGADHPPESVPEAPLVREHGGAVITLPYLPHRSTSRLVARVRSGAVSGANRQASGP